jgi:hypothetical protein
MEPTRYQASIVMTAKPRLGDATLKNGQGLHEKSVTQVKEPINHALMLAAQPLTA